MRFWNSWKKKESKVPPWREKEPRVIHSISMGNRRECPVCEKMKMYELMEAAFGCCVECYAKMRKEGEV